VPRRADSRPSRTARPRLRPPRRDPRLPPWVAVGRPRAPSC